MRRVIFLKIYFIFFCFVFFSERAARAGRCQTFFFFFFACSADHEGDWQPCKVVFFGLATNALNVIKNNNNNSEIKTQMKKRRQQSKEIKELGIQTQEASRWVNYPKMNEDQNPHRAHLYRRKKTK